MAHAQGADPFARTTRPAAYVPRPETEQALERLQARVLANDAATTRLVGPMDMGKSLLLRVLARRTAEQLSSVLVPNPAERPDDLARQVLEAMDDPRRTTAQARVVEVAEQLAGSGGLLLLIDNAERLGDEARAALEDWHRRSQGSLRSVCVIHVPISERRVESRGEADEVALAAPLELEESTALLEAAMDRASLHAPMRARFNSATMMQLQDRARGIPGRLFDEAAGLLAEWSASAAGPTDSPTPTQRRLAQLELSLAAQPVPPPVPRPEPRAAPDPERGREPASAPQRSPRDEARPDRLPEIEPAALLAAPPPHVAPRRPAARSRAPWFAVGAAGFALVVAIGLALRPPAPGDAGPGPAASVDDAPPVAAAPAPLAPSVAAPTPSPAAEVGSIEFQAPGLIAAETEAIAAAAPPPLVARRAAAPPEPAAAEPVPAATPDVEVVEGALQPGEWLAASFRRRGLPGVLAAQIAREVGDAFDFHHSQAGDRYRVTRSRTGELLAFDYELGSGDVVELRREDDRYRARRSHARAGDGAP